MIFKNGKLKLSALEYARLQEFILLLDRLYYLESDEEIKKKIKNVTKKAIKIYKYYGGK